MTLLFLMTGSYIALFAQEWKLGVEPYLSKKTRQEGSHIIADSIVAIRNCCENGGSDPHLGVFSIFVERQGSRSFLRLGYTHTEIHDVEFIIWNRYDKSRFGPFNPTVGTLQRRHSFYAHYYHALFKRKKIAFGGGINLLILDEYEPGVVNYDDTNPGLTIIANEIKQNSVKKIVPNYTFGIRYSPFKKISFALTREYTLVSITKDLNVWDRTYNFRNDVEFWKLGVSWLFDLKRKVKQETRNETP
ncbi:hypothetical protein QQ008_07350 [Fulvivirgaceae bacterium BMA10]|uniref:Uncharacterized protein n=1 Tax=Splendidivirga corallicola TaxID=3051826 RepID=A0ABT8KKC9_9BACT|nr:hypothetical protein [Fulvivirgaceae bacterium BMA10]